MNIANHNNIFFFQKNPLISVLLEHLANIFIGK